MYSPEMDLFDRSAASGVVRGTGPRPSLSLPPPPASGAGALSLPSSVVLDRCGPGRNIEWLPVERVAELPRYDPSTSLAFNNAGWIAVTTAGYPAVTFMDGKEWVLCVRDPPTGVWYRHRVAKLGAGVGPTVGAEGAGLLLVGTMDNVIVAARATLKSARTVVFTPLSAVSPSTDTRVLRPAACILPSGNPGVVYSAERSGVPGIYLCEELSGWGWYSLTVDDDPALGTPDLPSIAADDSSLMVVWRAGPAGDRSVYSWTGFYTRRAVAGSAYDSAENNSLDPAVCAVGDTGFVVGYTAYQGGTPPEVRVRYAPEYDTWSTAQAASDNADPDVEWDAFIQPASDGTYVVVVWEATNITPTSATLARARIATACAGDLPAAAWSVSEALDPGTARNTSYPTVAVVNGFVYAAWIEVDPPAQPTKGALPAKGALPPYIQYREGRLVPTPSRVPIP